MSKEEVKDVTNVEEKEETKTPSIDLDKFDKGREVKKEETETDDLAKLKAELEKERLRAREAEERAKKVKEAFDKAATDRAKLNRKLQQTSEEAQEPLSKLAEYEQKLAEYELNEKKTNLTYSLTESLGVNKDMANPIVSSIYNEDTNELSVGDLENSLRELVTSVRESAYKQGYETRDTEFASGKPRSLGRQEQLSAAELKKQQYLEQNKRKR